MIFMEVDWNWWTRKEFSSQLTGKRQPQGKLNVTSSSSQMGSSTPSTVSLKAWLINEITSHYNDTVFDRRTNQSTCLMTVSRKKMIRSHGHEILRQTVNKIALSANGEKRIVQDDNIHTLFRTHEWDIVKYLKWVWNFSLMKNSSLKSRLTSELFFLIKVDFKSTLNSRLTLWVALKIKVDFKMCKNCFFWNQGWLHGLSL